VVVELRQGRRGDRLPYKIRRQIHKTKAMREKRMAEKSYQYLAPFGGITRIRFKGFVQDVSAVSAPPLFS
jgi:hypothetical protein